MRSIPDPEFLGDDGAADPAVVEALGAYDADPDARQAETLTILQRARLLVPVVAMSGEPGRDEPADPSVAAEHEGAEMATVLMRGYDGRTALLAFTGNEALGRWDPGARPVPVTMATAAAAAVQERAHALVLDLAGPVRFVVETDDLRELARGHFLVPVDPAERDTEGTQSPGSGPTSAGFAWVRPAR